MLQLINEAELIADVLPETAIVIERHNPLFNQDDEMFTDLTYSFKLPLTDHNKDFIKNGHLIEITSEAYRLPVKLFIDGTLFHSGQLSYKITDHQIDALLKVNYGAIAEKANEVKMREIFTNDAMYAPYDAAFMKLVCQNPLNYPYSFFPVHNEYYDHDNPFVVNNWSPAMQTFDISYYKTTSPWFKLKYILQKLMEYLGFTAQGDWMDSPEAEEIFIYTRYYSNQYLNDSFSYLPWNLTVADFIKIVKQRFKICIFPDISSKTAYIHSAQTTLDNPEAQDLSEYVTQVKEIEILPSFGYKISLAPDEEDDLFLAKTADDSRNFIPSNTLTIGNKEEEVLIQASTLKVKPFAPYANLPIPTTYQAVYYGTTQAPNFPIRFMRYKGMSSTSQGMLPQAEGIELTTQDGRWYEYLNQSKFLKLSMSIPPHMLANLQVQKPIAFISDQGFYTTAIIKMLTYTAITTDQPYITATIECHCLTGPLLSQSQLIINTMFEEEEIEEIGEALPASYKAYFDQSQTPELEVQIYWTNNNPEPRRSDRYTQNFKIHTSTDNFGTSGELITPQGVFMPNCQIRVMNAVPLYLVYGGFKFNFQPNGSFYSIDLQTLPRYSYDGKALWIVCKEL